jgi:NAD(P)-dependent dehydrogenase (short-subunit alcohol dehydrogenase family)
MDAVGPGKTAVITGGAAGIGLAAAQRFAALGMNIAIADLGQDRLDAAAMTMPGVPVLARQVDVSNLQDLQAFEAEVAARFGGTDVLMCNAGIQGGSTVLDRAGWDRVMQVNLWGIIQGCQCFVPGMIARGQPGMVINTGSKQGITTPPGDPAYNMAKAGVKVFTEALEHDLRTRPGPRITAHLLIPGFVWTGLTRGDRTEKPDAAWTPEQTADFMIQSLTKGDFYILCPDNDVPRSLDEKRIQWAAHDIIENRPPLSRWHKDHAQAFKDFVASAG